MPWPPGGPNVCALVEETRWPIAAASRRPADRRPRPRDLREPRRAAARDLAGAGAGRPRGLHRPEPLRPLGAARRHAVRLRPALQPRPARGAGAPHRFEPERHSGALYAPPSHRKFWLQTAHAWERIGRRFDPRLVAGALLVEASKQVYARPALRREGHGAGSARGARRPRRTGPEPVGGHGRTRPARRACTRRGEARPGRGSKVRRGFQAAGRSRPEESGDEPVLDRRRRRGSTGRRCGHQRQQGHGGYGAKPARQRGSLFDTAVTRRAEAGLR